MLYAIDVSHHQQPSALDWAGMRTAGCDLCIVRLTYGTKKDERAKEHIARARDNGFAIGAYAFARTVESAADQFQAFGEAAEAADYGRPEDVVPALDMEDDTEKRPISPAHVPIFRDFALFLHNWKSQGAYAYITQRDWGRLGKPAFVLAMPLFVAHYAPPTRLEPATPNGMPWALWQHRVGPFQIQGPSGYDAAHPVLDQSRVRALSFFNGENMTFAEPGDEELRKAPDVDGTADIRGARHAASVRAYAQGLATDSRFDLLDPARDRAYRAELDTLDDAPESDVDPQGENQS